MTKNFPTINVHTIGIAFVAFVVLTLSACGFHLRGAQTFPFKEAILVVESNTTLSADIARRLSSNGVKVTTRTVAEMLAAPAGANAAASNAATPLQIRMDKDAQDRSVLTVNTAGRVREYQLKHSVLMSVTQTSGEGKNDKEILPVTTLEQKRDISFNESQLLAKESEEQQIYTELRAELVNQIMRRLANLKL